VRLQLLAPLHPPRTNKSSLVLSFKKEQTSPFNRPG
jgi:hypothetical protein